MSGARLNHVNGLSTSGTVGLFPRTSPLVELVDQTYFFTDRGWQSESDKNNVRTGV